MQEAGNGSISENISRKPTFDDERCVHGRLATASCRCCVEACPHGAIVLDDHALGLDEEACTGCALCRPACPEAAISFPATEFLPLIDRENGVAMWACTHGEPLQGQGRVPCLNAIGDRDLQALSAAEIKTVRTACAGCTSLAGDASLVFEAALARANRIRLSRRQPRLSHECLDEASWQRQRAALFRRDHDLDQRRRRLFAAFVEPSGPASRASTARKSEPLDALYRFMPVIDEVHCVGCDACVQVCPHAAITLAGAEAGSLMYAFAPGACTGCAMCRDVCETGAVTIGELQPYLQEHVILQQRRCSKCGATFHRPAQPDAALVAAGEDICRICAVSNHAERLFQVQS